MTENTPATASALETALAQLSALHPKKIDLGLSRIERVLSTLGDPHKKLPPTVHIAGTNGKGSTVAMLRAMAEADGLKAHVYTSPHLVHFRERIVVASEEISDTQLLDVIARVQTANDGQPLSFFEATTAAAFLAFAETPADICIIEVGLGGRYDATNVIENPAVVGITPVDLDHAEFLGRDIAGIGREKAGIMKPYCPAAVGPQRDAVRAVMEAAGNKNNITPLFWGQDFRTYRQHGRLVYENGNSLMDLPLPALIGEHQIKNAGLAITLARHMQISDRAIERGLETVSWPARLQNLTTGPYADLVAESGGELWLDGGHNPHAALALASAMAELESETPRPLILVTGILANKDIGGFLDAFQGLASAVIGVTIPGHAALAPETLIELARARFTTGYVASNLTAAVQLAINTGEGLSRQTVDEPIIPPRILICGSLYLAGEVLSAQ
ncbi:folylpolyglutamate synthase/dihydrofolate synthase family protein [Fretibacter rubidus]|uniref:bifunctional folylpolyglutamate synthase/dihydrofolate synthase n=1 Tax=Fretibacter rubidus TaxID=570162 RepID=UPI00352A4E01